MKPEKCFDCHHKINPSEIIGDYFYCTHCDRDLPYPPMKYEDMEIIEDIQSSLSKPLKIAMDKHGIILVRQALRWIYED